MTVFEKIADWASDRWEDISSTVSDTIETTKDAIEHIPDILQEWTAPKVMEDPDPVRTIIDAAEQGIHNIVSTVTSATEVEPMPEEEIESTIKSLGPEAIQDVVGVLTAVEEDVRNADLINAAKQFDDALSTSSDEDMAETAIGALTDMIAAMSEATQQEIKEIVGERVFNMLSLDFPTAKDMVAQYLSSVINGGAEEADIASVMMSVAYSRMSDEDRRSFLQALRLTGASVGLLADSAVTATGMIASLLDVPAVGGAPWFQTLGGVQHLCVPLVHTPYVMCFATSRVKGLDVRVFALHEGELQRLAGKGLGRLLKGTPTGAINAVTALLTSGMRADALEAAYDRSLLDNLLSRLTSMGYSISKSLLSKALDTLALSDITAAKDKLGTPVSLEDEADEGNGFSASFATLSEDAAPWARKRDTVMQGDGDNTTAFQRGQARRARAVVTGEGQHTAKTDKVIK